MIIKSENNNARLISRELVDTKPMSIRAYSYPNVTINYNEDTDLEERVTNLETNFSNLDADKNYEYRQDSAASVWSIDHNLNKYPSVTILDSTGEQCLGDITHLNKNSLIITFTAAFSGKASLN